MDGSEYWVTDTMMNWDDGKKHCEDKEAYLAFPDTVPELDRILV